ncbi:MAG: lysophospholipid acyltransferase family protein [Sutterellaceae bacterium]|nr:lysophospholipid acyltransferase family protein [Sutterellaceae bacterium]
MLITILSRFWVAVIKSLRHVPMPVRNCMARALACLMWAALADRRHVTLTNLKLCFPDMGDAERVALAKKVYRRLARAALDHGVLWAGSREDIENMVKFEGLENLTEPYAKGEPVIVIAPHFIGLDAAGIAFNLHVRGCSLYQRQSNPVWDKAALQGRLRFADPVLIAKSGRGEDLKAVIRAIRDGMPFYYLPDMDHGRKNSIFVPFFGTPAATVPMVSRLAKVTRAKVLFCVSEMTDSGYVIHVSQAWENFPTESPEADTRHVTEQLENWIQKLPDQYLWTHRRFKTRPEGEPSVY